MGKKRNRASKQEEEEEDVVYLAVFDAYGRPESQYVALHKDSPQSRNAKTDICQWLTCAGLEIWALYTKTTENCIIVQVKRTEKVESVLGGHKWSNFLKNRQYPGWDTKVSKIFECTLQTSRAVTRQHMFEQSDWLPDSSDTHFHFAKPYPSPDRTVLPPPTLLGKISFARPLPKPAQAAPQPAPTEEQGAQNNSLAGLPSTSPDKSPTRQKTTDPRKRIEPAVKAESIPQPIVPKQDPYELELAAQNFLFGEERKPVIKQETPTVKEEPDAIYERLQSALRTFEQPTPGAQDSVVRKELEQELAREFAQFQAINPDYNRIVVPKRESTAELGNGREQSDAEIQAELRAQFAAFTKHNPDYIPVEVKKEEVKEEEDETPAKRVKLEHEDSYLF
ncbi:hypothetical protein BOTBODRAFT_34860 [Botryobasidium botryosum FD-172 SS1]|uniref:Uncharacterized protein n=1 Tax=Botryobasidium botryosum (strain FD-172 SS1) TaxID=930990 RepID=A0A067M8A2_BOTB1|nr:hypothetical protein BOTBODRAFT_34860 [Botryobasidium botryosum FD-172 SS1]